MTTAASEDVAQGRVISQDPQAGDLVDPDASVDFVRLRRASRRCTLPDVVGQNKDDAADQLRGEGLRVVLDPARRRRPQGRGRRDAAARPAPRCADGSKVTLFWSDGPEQVPSVVGKTEDEATAADRGRRVQGQPGDRLHDQGQEGHRAPAEPERRPDARQGQHRDDRGLHLRGAGARRRPDRRRHRRRRPSASP